MNSGSSTRKTNPAAFMADANRCGSSGSSLTVTWTSALKRGTPYAMTAWAPNTYQRPQPASTFDSAVRSSTAAGGSGTGEQLGQAYVSEKVLLPGAGIGPIRIVQQCLSAQLVGDAQTLKRSVAGDALGPIRVLGSTRRSPLTSHIVANATADHACSVARTPRTREPAGDLGDSPRGLRSAAGDCAPYAGHRPAVAGDRSTDQAASTSRRPAHGQAGRVVQTERSG